MRRLRWSALATIVIILVIIGALTISFLPTFVGEVWQPLWDAEWQPMGPPARSFAAAGPLCGVLPWAALVAVPIASLFVLVWFTLVAVVTLLQRKS